MKFEHKYCETILESMQQLGTAASSKQIAIKAGLSQTDVQIPLRELLGKHVITKYGNGYFNLPKTGPQKAQDQDQVSKAARDAVAKIDPGNDHERILKKCDIALDLIDKPAVKIPPLENMQLKLAVLDKFEKITDVEIAQQFRELSDWLKKIDAIGFVS